MFLETWMLALIGVIIIGVLVAVKLFTYRKCKKMQGFKGLNDCGSDRGWKVH